MMITEVRLEPFDPTRHGDLLALWVAAPHVARWWGDPKVQLEAALRRPAEGGDALIIADGAPVGYVRWEKAARNELDAAGLDEVPDGTMDIDIAIGEADYTGLGIAVHALKQVVRRLAARESVPMIMMATSVENAPAISAFRKAGFRQVRRFQDPDYGDMWLLAFDVAADE